MGKIWLLDGAQAQAGKRLQEYLGRHFAAERLVALDREHEALTHGDVVVVVLAAAAPGLVAPVADLPPRNLELLTQAVRSSIPVIPLLADGALMPPSDQWPAALQPLAYQHALPLRLDQRFPRDAGRLVSDVEAHLRQVVGRVPPADYWLLPLGGVAAAIGLTMVAQHWTDLWDFPFVYRDPAAYRSAMQLLHWTGGGLLGLGLAAWSSGWSWRRYRLETWAQAAAQRRGEVHTAQYPDLPTAACRACGWASFGWGLPAALVATLCAALAWRRNRRRQAGREFPQKLAIGVTAAWIGAAACWLLWRQETRLGEAIAAYAAAETATKANNAAEAERLLQQALTAYPRYAASYVAQARLAQSAGDSAAAFAAIDRALAMLPATAGGLFAPRLDVVEEAYELRAALHRERGDVAAAEADARRADDAVPWLEIFDGALRFWDPRRAPAG
jgi:hypothetical protein